MKRYILTSMLIAALVGCGSETEQSVERKRQETEQGKEEAKLPVYSSVRELLETSSDYSEENGTLKFVSENRVDLHVQVSKPIIESDSESIKQEIAKREFVYVAYQVFAQTDVDTITITSIPVDLDNRKKYYKEYKKSATVDRIKAKAIMKKYAGTSDFSALFKPLSTIWVPSDKFSELKFNNLDLVFYELAGE